MRYSIFSVARTYCEEFRKVTSRMHLVDNDNGFTLFIYVMKKIYRLETNEYSKDIQRYADPCIQRLSNVDGVPKKPAKMSFEDRSKVVGACQGVYASLLLVERGIIGVGVSRVVGINSSRVL